VAEWIYVCRTDEIDRDDLIRWDCQGRSYAIYNTEKGFFATDGHCTHEDQHLEDGMVIGMVIECPLHGGRFDIATGRALSPPVCLDLIAYPLVVREDRIFVEI
jgi:3-phenylpropionate/trans-cinnamate dioxygenase ferredoxin subunit